MLYNHCQNDCVDRVDYLGLTYNVHSTFLVAWPGWVLAHKAHVVMHVNPSAVDSSQCYLHHINTEQDVDEYYSIFDWGHENQHVSDFYQQGYIPLDAFASGLEGKYCCPKATCLAELAVYFAPPVYYWKSHHYTTVNTDLPWPGNVAWLDFYEAQAAYEMEQYVKAKAAFDAKLAQCNAMP